MPDTPSRTPLVCFGDDRDALDAAAENARGHLKAAEADIALAEEAQDQAAYDRACAEFDRYDDDLVLINRRIEELEEEAAWDEIRERRREYWQAAAGGEAA